MCLGSGTTMSKEIEKKMKKSRQNQVNMREVKFSVQDKDSCYDYVQVQEKDVEMKSRISAKKCVTSGNYMLALS